MQHLKDKETIIVNPSVISVAWPWRKKASGEVVSPAKSPSKVAVLGQSILMAAIGAFLFWKLGKHVMGIIAWCLATVVLVSGFFIPRLFAAIERFGKLLGKWVGIFLTWGLLAPFYYLCFSPMHLALKIRGKDPLQRQFPTREATYWVSRKPVSDLSQYRKQF